MPLKYQNGKLTTSWQRVQARRRWKTAITKVLQQNRIKRNRATARRRLAFRRWARARDMTSRRYKNWNWLNWARYKRQRFINSGYNTRTYRFYK